MTTGPLAILVEMTERAIADGDGMPLARADGFPGHGRRRQFRVNHARWAGRAATRNKGAPGRIVMISSVGGKNANPFMGPYNASKFGLEGMSEALRRELMVFGIDVIVVAPGAVATPSWDKADAVDGRENANTP